MPKTKPYICSMDFTLQDGIRILTEPQYQPLESNPPLQDYVYAYRITIENKNNFPVKLLRRHWFIYESHGLTREVEGEGVVGVQPVILPDQSYQYISACRLSTEIGMMKGTYLLENVLNKKQFRVAIPAFKLVFPAKLN
jgi:ApaG protein